MDEGHSFSISFHQGEVNFPYDLKIQVSKIDNDDSRNYAYRLLALKKYNEGNPNK